METRYRPRELGAAVRDALDDLPVVVVTGLRQAGKSTFLQKEPGLERRRYLTRDDLETLEVARRDPGVEVVRLPPRPPNLNAHAERFVKSIKHECLNRIIFFGDRSLRRATREFAAHYHEERNHQGLGNRLIDPAPRPTSRPTAIECVERLGGMLRLYRHAAA